jgi:branched-chain amino acid transport system permease protein
MLLATMVGGISLGFLYGLVALTLILLVRTTGVLNFAAAEIGMLCAFMAFAALTQLHMPVALAVAVTLTASVVLGVVIYAGVVLVRPSDPLTLSLRTLGLLLIVNGVAYKIWGANSPYTFPSILPAGAVAMFGLNISYTQLLVIAFAIVIAIAVWVLTERTRLGLLLRAVSSDREAAADLGVAVVLVDLMAWCMATVVACCVGVLVAHLNFLAPEMMAPILLAGFAAAQLGDMRSMRVALAAGVLLGIIQSLSSVYFNQPEWSQILSFIVLTIGLVIRGQFRTRVVAT